MNAMSLEDDPLLLPGGAEHEQHDEDATRARSPAPSDSATPSNHHLQAHHEDGGGALPLESMVPFEYPA